MKHATKPSRRSFLASSTAFATPFILPSHIWAAETKPNDRITMGFIGMGKQNRGLLGNFLYRDVQVVGVCDVDQSRLDGAQKKVNDWYTQKPEQGTADCFATKHFEDLIDRKDIDALCIATPDHWHAIQTVAALNSGKDVYCEKPLTHNVNETIAVIAAVEKNKRVLQTGSMQRSWKEFRVACELVRNGVVGEVKHAVVTFGGPGKSCDLPTEKMEPGLDWDRWLGPAPERGYHSDLSPRGIHDHFPHWRRYREFGGGGVTDIGAHHVDIAHWALGLDESGPIKITPPEKEGASKGAVLEFADGVTIEHNDGFGMEFTGTKGTVFVNRRKFQLDLDGETFAKFTKREDGGSLESALIRTERAHLPDNRKVKLYKSKEHLEDFLNSMHTRTKPITHEGIGGRGAVACNLLNLAYYHGETMEWNPDTMTFANGTGKAEWLTRDYRGPWKI